jgi:hypothetical protein
MLGSLWYEKLGVDLHKLKSILKTKLIIDNRTSAGFYNYKRKEDSLSDATAISMFISLVIGATFLLYFTFSDDITRLTLYFSSLIIMLSMLIIVNFTSVLFDLKDNYTLLPKPVNSNTLLFARLLHTLIYLSKLAIPMIMPGLVAIGISRGLWASIVFIPILAMVIVFAVFVTNIFYLLLFKIAKPNKLNSIISFFQIVFSILIFILSQLVSKLMQSSTLENYQLNDQIFLWFMPSYWFASTWKLFFSFSHDAKTVSATLIGITVFLLSALLVIKYLAPAFQRKLYLSSTSASKGPVNASEIKKNRNKSTAETLANWITTHSTEHASFLFTLKMMARTRDFKFTVYPILAQMLIPFAISLLPFLYKSITSGSPISFDDFKLAFVLLVYTSSAVFYTTLNSVPYTERFRSAWIYFTLPIETPGMIFTGVIKACFMKFFIPLIGFITILSLMLFGIVILPNVVFGFCNSLLFCSIIALFTLKEFPFSIPRSTMERTGAGCFPIIFMGGVFLIGALPHYFLYNFPKVMLSLSLITSIATILVYRSIAKITWSDLKHENILEEELIN